MKRFLFLPLLFCSFLFYNPSNPVKEVIQRMLKANDILRSAKFTIYTEERMKDGKVIITNRFVKMQSRPKQIYFYSVKPNSGMEIIWREGWNNNKMLVSPGSFPFVTFSMNPNSRLARKDTHHSIKDLGFDYVSGIVNYYLKVYGDRFYNYITLSDTVQWDNHSCIIATLDFKEYAEINYTIKKNETILDVAEKFHLSEYSIMIMNPSISYFDDVRAGQIIKISNFYNRKIEFYIDRNSWLPLRQFIYDQKGLYEKYEMKSFLLNPVFKSDEFSPENKEYKF